MFVPRKKGSTLSNQSWTIGFGPSQTENGMAFPKEFYFEELHERSPFESHSKWIGKRNTG